MNSDLKKMNEYGKIFVRKTIVYEECGESQKGLLDTFKPKTVESRNYRNWIAVLDWKTCFECRSRHGQIYQNIDIIDEYPPLHERCRCVLTKMDSVYAGKATKNGDNGADYWLKYFGKLPNYYVSSDQAKILGWKRGKSPVKYVPGKMISMGVYNNDDGHLPEKTGRIWYEADINYYEGKRNGHRILWSDDGLIFVTYNHYQTFYEII